MSGLQIATIAFNTPWAIQEQIRLLPRFLTDEYQLTVFDNSSDEDCSNEIENSCDNAEVNYIRLWLPKREHYYALQSASEYLRNQGGDYIGFLDHDIWPARRTAIIPFLDKIGFFGIGQRHGPTGHRYLWPGFAFFKSSWLDGKHLNFDGIRGALKKDDGDTGSANWSLFNEADWEMLDRYPLRCSYERLLDDPNAINLQAWGYERIGNWIHMTNASKWLQISSPYEREVKMREVLMEL